MTEQQKWDAYKVLTETRNLEINLFWERSNYFLVLSTALAVGFFNIKEEEFYRLVLAAFGAIVSYLWLRVLLGAKHWQARWETRLHDFERECFPSLEFFGAEPLRIRADVAKGLDFFGCKPYSFKRLVHKGVLSKPSVIVSMTLLALLFMIGWLLLACNSLWRMYHVPHCFI